MVCKTLSRFVGLRAFTPGDSYRPNKKMERNRAGFDAGPPSTHFIGT